MRLAIALVALAACSPTPTPIGPPDADAGGLYGCSALCVHERDLGCPEAAPTREGSSCETVCSAAQRIQPWPLDKMTAAPTCAAVADALKAGQ